MTPPLLRFADLNMSKRKIFTHWYVMIYVDLFQALAVRRENLELMPAEKKAKVEAEPQSRTLKREDVILSTCLLSSL